MNNYIDYILGWVSGFFSGLGVGCVFLFIYLHFFVVNKVNEVKKSFDIKSPDSFVKNIEAAATIFQSTSFSKNKGKT